MADPQATDDHAAIRASVRALCAGFPGEYWRALDRDRAYPADFVAALTKAGFLAALISEQYGGSGLPLSAAAAIMEEIHASGGNGAPSEMCRSVRPFFAKSTEYGARRRP